MKTVKKGIKLCLRLVFVFLAVTCVLTALGYGYAADTFNRIKENIVRLHVIANSDSQEDQALKLQVRDKVIECIDSLELDAESAGAYVKALCENLNSVKEQLEDYLRGLGSDYGIDVTVGESNFPAKSYGDIVLPAGRYNAVRVTIGAGEGKNWWCVMFPPLCYTNNGSVMISETENALLKKTLPDEAYKTVKGKVTASAGTDASGNTISNPAGNAAGTAAAGNAAPGSGTDTAAGNTAAGNAAAGPAAPGTADAGVSLVADDGLISDRVQVSVRFKIVELFQESGRRLEKVWQSCKQFLFRK